MSRTVLRHASDIPIRPLDAESRFARLTIATLSAIHLVLLISLVFVLFSVGHALADETDQQEACGGENLIEAMAEERPEKLKELEREAAEVENGEGRFWRISREGTADSWLFGTMHVADPRVTELPDAAEDAFEEAGTVVVETDSILSPEASQQAILANPELTMFTDGQTLKSLMSEEDYALVADKLDDLGLSIKALSRMKPWMITAFVSMPPCELERRNDGAAFLDMELAQRAVDGGKTLEGLETAEEQLSAMAELPMEFHIQGLVETVSLGPVIADVMTTMTDLYVDGEIGMILPMIRAAAPEAWEQTAEGYAAFEERMVRTRNHTMAERAAPILEEGSAFIAVGALHLPGEEGLVALLRGDGYTVTRAD